MSSTPSLSELRANLYFGLTGTNYVFMYEPSPLSLVIKDYTGDKNTTYLTFDTTSNILNIPTGTTFDVANANIDNLTVLNFTGVGPIGITGTTGLPGFQGYQGNQGFNGIQGLNGFQNSGGTQGLAGFQGRNAGPQGNQGFQGVQGPQGQSAFTVFNSGVNRLLTSNNSSTGAVAQTDLIYTSTNNLPSLTVGGDISATGLYIQSTINYTGGAININPTRSNNFLDSYGKNLNGSYATRIAGLGAEEGNGIAVDSVGNSYVTGKYGDPSTIYNSDGSVFRIISGSGANDCFILSYGSTGMATWVSRISGSSSDIGNKISLDTSNNIYVTGSYTQLATVYNSDNTTFSTLSGSGSNDCLVVKFGPTGMGSWVTKISGTSSDVGNSIAVDSSGSSYVTGNYTTPATVYNSDGTAFSTISGSGSNDCFIVKYGPTGMGSYVSKISGASSDIGYGIAVDSLGNSYVAGSFISTITVYNSDNTAFTTRGSSGNTDGFLVKYGPTGMGNYFCRIASISAGFSDFMSAVVVDDQQNAYVTGTIIARDNAVTIFNSDNSVYRTVRVPGSLFSTYLLKYGPTGMGQFFNSISAVGLDCNSYTLAKDNLNNIYLAMAGTNSNNLLAYNSDGTIYSPKPNVQFPGNGSTLIKYNSTGMCQATSVISTINTSSCLIYGIGCDNFGNSYVTGLYFNATDVVYNSDNTQFKSLSNSGSNDCFVVKFSPEYVLKDLDNISSNNGRLITVNSTDTSQSSRVLVETQADIIYATYSFTNFITFVFYNGSWYVLGKS